MCGYWQTRDAEMKYAMGEARKKQIVRL
jgi:hypothetical protein